MLLSKILLTLDEVFSNADYDEIRKPWNAQDLGERSVSVVAEAIEKSSEYLYVLCDRIVDFQRLRIFEKPRVIVFVRVDITAYSR